MDRDGDDYHSLSLESSTTYIDRWLSLAEPSVGFNMVFRGKPSRACERCRARRLKCDLKAGSCGQCVRAKTSCSGYRDTSQLRIQNESQAVRSKVINSELILRPLYVADVRSRDAFFANYVYSSPNARLFMGRYLCTESSMGHLELAVEAAGLAFLWNQTGAEATLAAARQRYVLAIHMINKALKSPRDAVRETTLLSSLMLDIFEKVTNNNSTPRNSQSWVSHAHGALAIAKLRGFEQFVKPEDVRILMHLSTNYLINCVVSATEVPDEWFLMRDYASRFRNMQDPKWLLTELMVKYASLRSEIREGVSSKDRCAALALELDLTIQALDLAMPPSWRYVTKAVVDGVGSERCFGAHYDCYPSRTVSHVRNILRVVRILLNEYLLENADALTLDDRLLRHLARSRTVIDTLANEICAGVQQYLDCDGPARAYLEPSPLSTKSPTPPLHEHTRYHTSVCYILIYPLYVVGRCRHISSSSSSSSSSSPSSRRLRPWIIAQLIHISTHFHLHRAANIARLLERAVPVADPWEVYASLGSYAFAA